MPGGWAMGCILGQGDDPPTPGPAGRQRRRRLSQSRCLCWHLLQFTGETQAPCSYSTDNATEVPRLHINKVDIFHFFLWLCNYPSKGWSLTLLLASILLKKVFLFFCLLLYIRLLILMMGLCCCICNLIAHDCNCTLHLELFLAFDTFYVPCSFSHVVA